MPSVKKCRSCDTPVDDPQADLSCHTCPNCGSADWVVSVTTETFGIDISPFMFQCYAKDFYNAYLLLKGGPRFSPARLTVLGQSIELAAKRLHVAQGKTVSDLTKMSHDLMRCCDDGILAIYRITVTPPEAVELKKLSDLYLAKAFEYPWFKWPGCHPEVAGKLSAATGWRDLPDESVVEGLLVRLLAATL